MLDNKKPIVTINLTPLVDVSLVLVVIFLATAPMFLQSGIIVASGEKKSAPAQAPAKTERTILIALEPGGVFLNRKKVSLDELSPLLRSMLAESGDRRVIIRPDRTVRHGDVVQVLDLAKQAGAASLVILGRQDQEP